MRRWRARHPDLRRERNREYKRDAYRRDPAKFKAQRAAYLAKNPAVKRASDQAYRARRLVAPGSFTGAEWRTLVKRWGNVCAYDGAPGPLEADHRIPLSRGGTNYIGNILPACRSCNSREHTLTEQQFRALLASERAALMPPTVE